MAVGRHPAVNADTSDPGLGQGKEFDLIRGLAARLGSRARGLGDDCATLQWPGGLLVLSSDLSVEGVHFRREWLQPDEIGWRATAAAMSDLAAAGAEPIGVLASVGVPRDERGLTEEIMAGVGEACGSVGAVVLGGDLSRADAVTIDVCAVGSAESPVGRGGAQPGDSLWVTGQLGGARAAVTMWRSDMELPAGARSAFTRPEPCITAGRWLAEHGAKAMIDVSDGVASDVGHIAARSNVQTSVTLEQLPLGPGVDEVAALVGMHPAVFAAAGGEDYQLLVAMPGAFGEKQADNFREVSGIALTNIGRVEQGGGVQLLLEGVPVQTTGFDHFE